MTLMDRLAVGLAVGSKIEYKLFDTMTGEYKGHRGVVTRVLR